MLQKIKTLCVVASVAAVAPVASFAATISGQIDISGSVNLDLSDFSEGGNVSFDIPENFLASDPSVVLATGDFATILGAGDGLDSEVTLTKQITLVSSELKVDGIFSDREALDGMTHNSELHLFSHDFSLD